jgi:hypothetical protein
VGWAGTLEWHIVDCSACPGIGHEAGLSPALEPEVAKDALRESVEKVILTRKFLHTPDELVIVGLCVSSLAKPARSGWITPRLNGGLYACWKVLPGGLLELKDGINLTRASPRTREDKLELRVSVTP